MVPTMAYRKPPFFVRKIFNPLAMRFGVSGTQALTVTGRISGDPRRVPVTPVEYEGDEYLVSPRGESDWVKNLRAADTAELSHKGKSRTITATEVPVAERAPILDLYQKQLGRAVASHFSALPDPADHPTFRISAA